jgi:uncharacterized protein YggE
MKTLFSTIIALLLIGLGMKAQYTGNAQQSDNNCLSGNATIHAFGNYGGNFNQQQGITIPINNASGSNITLKADVMMNVKASSYTVIFAITQNGPDVLSTDSMMSGRIDQIAYGLGRLGIAEEDIHIDAVSMVPTYAFKLEEKKFSKRSVEVPTGFEMKKNIHILVRNARLIDPIISEMAYAEVYDIVKVEYNIDGIQTYYEELRKAAKSVIETKMATYTGFDMHLTLYALGDGFAVVYPQERYKSYTAYNSGSSMAAVRNAMASTSHDIKINGNTNFINIENSKKQPEQQFIIQTADKNRTTFYDRVAYNQFDKVINADIEEPCIQITYSLQTSYTMITEEVWKQQQTLKNPLPTTPEPYSRKKKKHSKINSIQ